MEKIPGGYRDSAFLKEAMVKVFQSPQINLRYRSLADDE